MPSPQGDFSDFQVHRELDHLFGGTPWTAPATLYLGLSVYRDYRVTGQLAEPMGPAGRVAIPNDPAHWPAAAGRVKRNGVAIQPPTPTADAQDALSWFLTDGPGDADVLASGDLTDPVPIRAGIALPAFAVGALVFGR